MPRYKSEQIIVRMNPKLKRQLEKKAEENQTTVSELVRFLIETMLSKDNSSNTEETEDK
jgi:predicted HicB family RNase H-like nuclease